MPIRRTRKLLDDLVAGDVLDVAGLDSLMAEASEEDQFLDYKSGKQDEEKLKHTIRKWVTGFANADGGTLILGVNEPKKGSGKPRDIDGVRAPSGSPLMEWTARVLADLTGGFSPTPSFFPVRHPRGEVLVIATRRAPQLIPYAEGTRIRYAIRIGDSTLDVPEFLITDLLHGRRNRPIVSVRSVELSPELSISNISESLSPKVRVTTENLGFVTAEEVEIGLVSWSWHTVKLEQTPHLLQYLDLSQVPLPYYPGLGKEAVGTWEIRRTGCRVAGGVVPTLKAFDSARTDWVSVGRFPPFGSGLLTCGLYVMPKGSMPDWYEVDCFYGVHDGRSLQGTVKVERLYERKPKLRWG
jgi:Divergent AAA domain.